MTCQRCSKEHSGAFGSGKYCSRACANSRTFSDEAKQRKSQALKGRPASHNSGFKKGFDSRRKQWTAEERKRGGQRRRESCFEKYNNTSFEDLNFGQKRRRIFEEQENKCNCCHLNVWLGRAIKLEVHHRDGNKKNNSRENLEGLCPNCHSFTDTWRKNK